MTLFHALHQLILPLTVAGLTVPEILTEAAVKLLTADAEPKAVDLAVSAIRSTNAIEVCTLDYLRTKGS